MEKLKAASSQAELAACAAALGRSAGALSAAAARRQHELREPAARDQLAAARAMLKKHSTMLLTASKVTDLAACWRRWAAHKMQEQRADVWCSVV